jgi:hypothetical protein
MSDLPLAAREWLGDAHFRTLGYYFRLRWSERASGRLIRGVLGEFEVSPDPCDERNPPTPNVPPVYSVVEVDPHEEYGWQLWYGDALLLDGASYDNTLRHLFWHINAETCRQTGSFLLIHAGAVATPSGDGLILPGESGSGKTTMVAGLVRAGFGYLSDEAAAIDPVSRQLFPFPKALTIKEGSFDLFPDLPAADESIMLEDQWLVPPAALRAGSLGSPCSVRWIVTLRYEPGAATDIDEITPGASVMELGRNGMNLTHYGARALPLLADIARGAESYRLVTGDLAEAVETLHQLTAETRSDPALRRG